MFVFDIQCTQPSFTRPSPLGQILVHQQQFKWLYISAPSLFFHSTQIKQAPGPLGPAAQHLGSVAAETKSKYERWRGRRRSRVAIFIPPPHNLVSKCSLFKMSQLRAS